MIKAAEGQHYQVTDMGHCLEISSNLLFGIFAGIEKYTKKGYEFNWDAIKAMGNVYIVPTIGKEISETEETADIVDLKEQLQVLTDKNKKVTDTLRTTKSQVTKLKAKIKKLEDKK